MSTALERPSGQGVRFAPDLHHGVEWAFVGLACDGVDLLERLVAKLGPIFETLGCKGVHEGDDGTGAIELKHAVKLPLEVEHGDVLGPDGVGVVGLFFYKGRYFLVEGERVCSWHESCLHGGSSALAYVMKYVVKAGRNDAVSEGTESAQRINKTIPLKSCTASGCNYPQGDCLGVCS